MPFQDLKTGEFSKEKKVLSCWEVKTYNKGPLHLDVMSILVSITPSVTSGLNKYFLTELMFIEKEHPF